MWLNNYQWHFDYVRLAKDSGFSFEKTKCPLDKNKICMIDLDKIITERDVGVIEQLLSLIVQYSVESCEHLGIIDQNFLKLFRISQLAVEYLLFCKKYLDNTVTLLKGEMKTIQSENKELKEFNNELKQHTDTLLEKLNIRDSNRCFKCSKCPKAFSTEEYLAAHIQRHHSTDTEFLNVDIEMEIKEIKQKLNNTEKLIKNEELNPKLEDTLNKNYSKVSELLLKFESLKTQLENDFKILQTQKDFEEKYSKIFQIALDNVKHQVHSDINLSPSIKPCEKRNSVTQTDFYAEKPVQELPVENSSEKEHEEKPPTIEEQMKKVSEQITLTVDTSLKNVETQLQALWDKLQELETKKAPEKVASKENITQVAIEPPKPKIRQNLAKLQTKTQIVETETKFQDKLPSQIQSKTKLDDLNRIDTVEDANLEPPQDVTIDKSANLMYGSEETDSESGSKSESITEMYTREKYSKDASSSKSKLTTPMNKQSVQNLEQKSPKSLVKPFSSKITSKKEIQALLSKKFSDLGLSIEWKGIPKQTYTKTMDILNHQVNLIQRANPAYKTIRKKLLKEIDKEAAKTTKKPIIHKTKTRKMKGDFSLQNIRTSRTTLSIKKAQSAPQIEIKNRKMFETDSSSDENPTVFKRMPSNIIKRTEPYSAVISELKQTQKPDEIELNPGKKVLVKSLPENENIDLHTKGVLKNFSTTGPVAKKRVFFNLKSENSAYQQTFLKDIGGGSTTSVASSVLDLSDDGSEEDSKNTKDLSDSDFSIIDESGKKKVI